MMSNVVLNVCDKRCVGYAPIAKICQVFYENNELAVDFFRDHGMLPARVKCKKCSSECTLGRKYSCGAWRCHKSYKVRKKRERKKCNYSISDRKGSILEKATIAPWKVLLSICFWLRKDYSLNDVSEDLNLNKITVYEWTHLFGEISQECYENQKPIGGDGVVVELGETLVTITKYVKDNDSQLPPHMVLLGGVERKSKRFFIVPLPDRPAAAAPERDEDTFLLMVKRFVRTGSLVYSDAWQAYKRLGDEGLSDEPTPAVDQVEPEPVAPSRNIRQMWADLKEHLKRRGMRPKHLREYVSRYVLVEQVAMNQTNALHEFFDATRQLFKPGHVADDTDSDKQGEVNKDKKTSKVETIAQGEVQHEEEKTIDASLLVKGKVECEEEPASTGMIVKEEIEIEEDKWKGED